MHEYRLDQFRRNWPIVTAILVLASTGISFLLLPYNAFVTGYRPIPDEIVDYWALVQHSNLTTAILFMPFVLVILPSAIIIWRFRKHSCLMNLASIGLLSISFVFAVMIGFGIFVTMIFTDGTQINHLSTVDFDRHIYHLAFGSTTEGGGDSFHSRYLVYECELESEICQLIHDHKNICSYTSDCKPEASLIVIDKTLLLEVEDERAILVSN